jgi:hypothetical protein
VLVLEEVISGDADDCRAEDETIPMLLDEELGNTGGVDKIGGVDEIAGELEVTPTWTELLCT